MNSAGYSSDYGNEGIKKKMRAKCANSARIVIGNKVSVTIKARNRLGLEGSWGRVEDGGLPGGEELDPAGDRETADGTRLALRTAHAARHMAALKRHPSSSPGQANVFSAKVRR